MESAMNARAGENAAAEVAKVRSLRAYLAGGKSSGWDYELNI